MDKVLNLPDDVYYRLYVLFDSNYLPDRVEIILKNQENIKIKTSFIKKSENIYDIISVGKRCITINNFQISVAAENNDWYEVIKLMMKNNDFVFVSFNYSYSLSKTRNKSNTFYIKSALLKHETDKFVVSEESELYQKYGFKVLFVDHAETKDQIDLNYNTSFSGDQIREIVDLLDEELKK